MLRIVTNDSLQKITQAHQHIARHELPQAEYILRDILKSDPQHPGASHLLAAIAFRMGHPGEALELLKRAVALEKNNPDMWNDMGAVHSALGQLDDAIDCCQRVVTLAPRFPDGWYNLGYSLFNSGFIDEALESFKKAVALRPDFHEAHSIYLYSLYFHPNHASGFILDMHKHWDQTQAKKLLNPVPHDNDRSPGRRLRIGYVSPNFRNHSIGRFFEPLLARHNRTQHEIFLYADLPAADELSKRLHNMGDTWRLTFGKTDAQVAEMVRADKIDILVDLTMHMDANRLLAFARKPAPVQVSYLAYAGTTGLSAMDYRLSDPTFDPPGEMEPYSEKTIRLPRTYWCYQAPAEAPANIPAAARSTITFGCMNNFSKISPQAIAAWAQLLARVPQSRFLLLAPEGRSRQRMVQAFAAKGITEDRLEFVANMPASSYFSSYWRIDVALDPFPYGGGTTTCDALWMGIPLVTLRDRRAVGRGSASILATLGLTEWIASTSDEYVEIAARLASDRPARQQFARTARERMEKSPLMDAAGFARDIEAAFREMWRTWCAR